MTIPDPDHDDVAADYRLDVPVEAPEADTVEQRTPVREPAPVAGGSRPSEVDEGDLAESAREVAYDEEDDGPE